MKDNQAYLTELILTGAGDSYLAVDTVGNWYRQNMRIFANAFDLIDFDQEVACVTIRFSTSLAIKTIIYSVIEI